MCKKKHISDAGLIREICSQVKQPVLVRSLGGGRRIRPRLEGIVTLKEEVADCMIHRVDDHVLFNDH
jgi:hypothetical protein